MKNVEDIYALAPLQRLMLTHAIAHPASEFLVEQFQCRIQGPLEVDRLQAAWDAVVARHPLLRACFAWEGLKQPVQVIRQNVAASIHCTDIRDKQERDGSAEAESLFLEDRRHGFDLRRAPLHRLHVVRTAQQQWRLAWTCHHLILDGWSLGIVLSELFGNYAALERDMRPGTTPQRGFRDYLAWLERQPADERDEAWRALLAACPPLPSLPLDAERIDSESSESSSGTHECQLTVEQTASLAQLAAAQRVGLATIVEAAWAILLSCYAEQDDLIWGVAVAGRPSELPQLEDAVGPFMNNMPRRALLSGDRSIASVFRQIAKEQSELQPHESTPLGEIVRAAGLPAGRRLFETLVVFENYPIQRALATQLGGLVIDDIHGSTSANYLLSLIVLPGEQLALRLNFDRRRCHPTMADRLLDQLSAVLTAMVRNPEATIDELSFVDERGRRELADLAQTYPDQRILDAAGRLVPCGRPGQLWTSATDSIQSMRTVADPLDTNSTKQLRPCGYRARFDATGQIEYLGPVATPTMIDGHSVPLDEVNAVVRLHPLVVESAAVDLLDRAGRRQLAAFIVPSADATSLLESRQHGLLLSQVRRFAEQRLPAPLLPRMWRALDELPRSAQGDLDRALLPEVTAARSDALPDYVAPRDSLETRLCEIWSEILGVEPIGITDSFLDLGGYSSQAVSLLARLEEEFGRRLPLGMMFDEPSVERLAEGLRSATASQAESALVPLRPRGKRRPLFCVHPAGGTVFCYVELAGQLDGEIPIYGLQALGLDGLSAPHDSIEAMAAHYAAVMRDVDPTGPYQLCGWSTGGLIAFETARQLRAQGSEVACVALFDAGVPRAGETFGERDLDAQLQLLFPGESPEQWAALRDRSPEEQLAEFRRRAEAAQLLLTGAGTAQAKHIYEVFQANMQAVVAYRPQPYDRGLVMFRAAQHTTPMHGDPLLGWQPWVDDRMQVHEIDSGHLDMLQQPAVAQLAAVLQSHLLA